MASGGPRTTQPWPSRRRPSASARPVPPAARGRRRSESRWRLPSLHLGGWRLRALVLACLLAILASAAWWLYNSPLVSVQDVQVAGAESVDPQVVVAAAGLSGANILRADLDGARRRVEALPQVQSASVQRRFPHTVRVTVQERHPAAFWMINGRRYVVDSEGVVLSSGLPDPSAPIIDQLETGWQPNPGERVDAGALEVANRLLATSQRSLGLRVVRFEFRDSDGLTAIFDSGLRATFGDPHDFDYKVSVLYLLMRTASEQQFALHSVDLRFGDRLAFR